LNQASQDVEWDFKAGAISGPAWNGKPLHNDCISKQVMPALSCGWGYIFFFIFKLEVNDAGTFDDNWGFRAWI
jgi:hypothetical protein